ncbi:hypothetical protein [Nannocystis radixulma]|uniref:Uncharacterized protein n=1 Tax=Nannocystis radixulma TaxID=2995305 RepID=A0ABT5BMG9_9BACT|nr:hypothetical protein [Nannocystis radixulma]MDC0675356.1 hypothetical protein [Nannocystis radixulma]
MASATSRDGRLPWFLRSLASSSWEVTLPRHVRPRWPGYCLFSRHPTPTRSTWVVARDHREGAWLWRGWVRLAVPCRPVPAAMFHLRRALRGAGTVALAAGCFAFTECIVRPHTTGLASGLLFLAMFVLLLLPLVAWQHRRPLPLAVTVHVDRVDYAFRRRDTAEEFARLNAAPLVPPAGASDTDSPSHPGSKPTSST